MIANDFFKFCERGERISPKATLERIKEQIIKWSDEKDITEEQILIAAKEEGYRVSKKMPYKFNIMMSTSPPFMKREQLSKLQNFAPYYMHFHPQREKLLSVHEFFMHMLYKNSHKYTNHKTKKVINPDWNDDEYKKYKDRYSNGDYYSIPIIGKTDNWGRQYTKSVYKYETVNTGETYERLSLPYACHMNIVSDDDTMKHKLSIERIRQQYQILLSSNSVDPDLKIISSMSTTFSAANPHYLRFLERLLEMEPDLDLCCEERILLDL